MSSDWIYVATILVLGVTISLVAVHDAANTESAEIAAALAAAAQPAAPKPDSQ